MTSSSGSYSDEHAGSRVMWIVSVASFPTEALGHDLDPGAVVVTLPQRFALFLVGLEPDGAATAPELLPRVGESPAAAHVGDHDRLVEQIAQDGRDF